MTMILPDPLKKILLQVPTFTPALIGLPDERMTALVLRVDSLKSFKPKGLKFQVSFVGYEHERTLWTPAIKLPDLVQILDKD